MLGNKSKSPCKEMSLVIHCETSLWSHKLQSCPSAKQTTLHTFSSLVVITVLAVLLGSLVLKCSKGGWTS